MASLNSTNGVIVSTRTPINGMAASSGDPNNTTKSKAAAVKSEKRARDTDGGEYDEWAKKLVNRPIPQLQPTGGTNLSGFFQSGNNTYLIQGYNASNPGTSTCVGGDGLAPHNGFDMDSAMGRFTWITFAEDKHVPGIYRSGDVYCCVRMAEPIISNYLRTLPPEIAHAVILESHHLTQAEAKLLCYINSWHCDGSYGPEPFTVNDLIVKAPELEKYYSFLSFSYQVLQSGGGNKTEDYSKCGFVKVNQDSLIPYTVMSEEDKGIPLFYFEGQIDILNAKSELLSGWQLAYLKLCCKVQGVRKDLISGETLRIVKLVDLKTYFPKRTIFLEKNWPPAKSKSILPKIPPHSASSYAVSTVSQRWNTQILPNDPFDKSRSNSATLTTVRSATALPYAPAQYTSVSSMNGILSPSTSSTSNLITYPAGLNGVSRNGFSVGMTGSVTHATPAGVMSNRTSAANNASYTSVLVGPNGAQIQIPRNQVVAQRTTNLANFRVPGPPADTQKLTLVPEFASDRRDPPPYAVKMIRVDTEVIHCINQKPHNQKEYYIVLQEFLVTFFPTTQISIYPTCVSVLKSIGITTYLPNAAQIRAFNASGFSISKVWELPLIPATDAVAQLKLLKTLLTPKPMGYVRSAPQPQRVPIPQQRRPIL